MVLYGYIHSLSLLESCSILIFRKLGYFQLVSAVDSGWLLVTQWMQGSFLSSLGLLSDTHKVYSVSWAFSAVRSSCVVHGVMLGLGLRTIHQEVRGS